VQLGPVAREGSPSIERGHGWAPRDGERDNREGERVTPPTAWPAMAWRRRSISDDARERGERCRVCTGEKRARQELDHGFYRVREREGVATVPNRPLMAMAAGPVMKAFKRDAA
jgi:hypothetical protein